MAASRWPVVVRLRAWLRRPALRWPLVALLAAYAVFLAGVNLAINTRAPWGFLRPADHSSNISWVWGWSVLPGFATVHGFNLTVEDDNIQLGLRIDQARVRFEIPAFLHKTFHATAVHAQGTSFRFRVKRDAEAIEKDGAGLGSTPHIEGFSDPPRRGPPSPPFNGDRSIYWTIRIDGVRAETNEVWVESVRYVGQALAHGSFTFRPLTIVKVDAGLDIKGGDLLIEDSPLARALRGTLAVTVDRFDPLPEFGLEPLRHIATDLTLDGEVQNVALLNPVFTRMRAPTFASAPGHFDLFSRFDRGKLMPGSRFALAATRWEIARGRYQAVGTDTYVEGSIDPGPHGLVQISLGPYQVVDPQAGGEIIEGDGMILRMTSDRFNLLDRPFEDLGFEVQLESARVPDLAVLNAYLPKTEGFEVIGGKGEITGDFLRPPNGVGVGDFRIGAQEVALRLAKLELRGDLGLRARISGLASSAQELPITGANQLGGEGALSGRFTLGAVGEGDVRRLADFAANAEVVIHPFLPSEVHGAELLHYLSGELKLAGAVPGLEFLNDTLRERRVTLVGGAGQLALDARVSHGVMGRASEIDFASTELAVSGGGAQGHGSVSLHGRVEENRETPRLTVVAGVSAAKVGTPELRDLVSVGDLTLAASSPEVDLWSLTDLHPELQLTGRDLVLPDVSRLARWMPEAVRFSRGRATVGLKGRSPPEGPGRLDATLRLEGLVGTLGPIALSGQVSGGGALTGIAQEPWKGEVIARSMLEASSELEGSCHLVARGQATGASVRSESVAEPGGEPAGNVSTASVHFHARGELPATSGAELTGPQLKARATGNVDLAAEVTNLSYLNQFLAKGPVRVHGGGASVTGEVKIAAGTVAPGSTAEVNTHDLQVSVGPFWLAGPLHLGGMLGAPDTADRAQIQASLASFTLSTRFERRLLAEGGGVSLAWRAPAFTTEGMLLDSRFEGRAQQLTVPDLGSLTAYLPATKDLKLLSGSATASASLAHPSRDHGEAKIDLTANRAALLLGGRPFTSDVHIGAVLRALATAGTDGRPLLQTLDVGESTVDFSRVEFPTNRVSDREWWAKLRILRGELSFGDEADSKLRLSGDTALEARDVLPWLHLYGSGLGIPGWLNGLLAFNALKATAALELRGDHFALPNFEAKGNHLKLQGRLLLDEKHTAGDFLLDVGPFSVGLDVRDKHSGVQLVGAGSWYREKLKQPLE